MEEHTDHVTVPNLTSKILVLGSPKTGGSFGKVYQCTVIEEIEGVNEVAVKDIIIDPKRATAKIKKDILRELQVWLRLRHSTIVPLLSIAYVGYVPALVSQWMPSGELYQYLKNSTTIFTAFDRIELTMGVADGVRHLRSKNVVHGDLHPGNVLIDGKGKPRLTDFGLATIVGDAELQWGTTIAARQLNVHWRAPEVIGIESDPTIPTFESDIYSLGSVMFFIISGDIPWENKSSSQISIELSRKATPTRAKDIAVHHWNLIQKCLSRDPNHRPTPEEVYERIDQFRIDGSQLSISNQPVDLTGQITGEMSGSVGGGVFADVYACECKQLIGPYIKVAVKVIKPGISTEALAKFQNLTKTWAGFKHDRIVCLLGTAHEFGPPPAPALVFPWFKDTLRRLIDEDGATLSIRLKLQLLLDTATGLEYLHEQGIVHGDITSVR
ncbi:kinase-like domain-containing protein [Suillus ampliporus]|nr:kinase-like domain-containing protein [Suillus ampliporus]